MPQPSTRRARGVHELIGGGSYPCLAASRHRASAECDSMSTIGSAPAEASVALSADLAVLLDRPGLVFPRTVRRLRRDFRGAALGRARVRAGSGATAAAALPLDPCRLGPVPPDRGRAFSSASAAARCSSSDATRELALARRFRWPTLVFNPHRSSRAAPRRLVRGRCATASEPAICGAGATNPACPTSGASEASQYSGVTRPGPPGAVPSAEEHERDCMTMGGASSRTADRHRADRDARPAPRDRRSARRAGLGPRLLRRGRSSPNGCPPTDIGLRNTSTDSRHTLYSIAAVRCGRSSRTPVGRTRLFAHPVQSGTFTILYKTTGHHPSCFENLLYSLARWHPARCHPDDVQCVHECGCAAVGRAAHPAAALASGRIAWCCGQRWI